jgi:hypothetical protein
MSRFTPSLAHLWTRVRLLFLCLTLSSCDNGMTQSHPAPPSIPDLPLSLKAKQRSTTAIPGTDGKLRLTIDDITGGQVMASVAEEGGKVLIASRSFSPGKSEKFEFRGSKYRLKLDTLLNALIGEDFAFLAVVHIAPAGTLTEAQKVERLIARVAALEDAVFVRDGVDFVIKDEVKSLQKKWDELKAGPTSASDYIDKIAPKPKDGVDAYFIRFAGGRTLSVHAFLSEELRELDDSVIPRDKKVAVLLTASPSVDMMSAPSS